MLDVRKWVKGGALSLALLGACSGVALTNTVPYDMSSVQNGQYQVAASKTNNADVDYSHAPYYQALRGKTLSVGFNLTPPFAFVADSLSVLQGIDVDLINELQKRTGFNVEGGRAFVMDVNDLLERGYRGELDVVAGGLTLSQNRAKFFDFSAPYMKTALVLVTGNTSSIRDIKDLDGRRLAATSGSTAAELIQDSGDMRIEMSEASSVFMSLYNVHAKDADAVIVDRPMAEFYIKKWPDAGFHVVKQVSSGDYLGLLFKKNTEVSHTLQAAYRDMVQDGTVQRIVDNYMGHSANNVPVKKLASIQ